MEPQNQQQPPQVFTPGQQPGVPQPPQSPQLPQQQPQPSPLPPVQPPVEPEQPQAPAPLQYNSGQLEQQQAPELFQADDNQMQDDAISWSASEFIAHEKNGAWYAMLIAGALILAILVFVITREWFSIIAIAILAVAIGIFGNLKPKVLNYTVSPNGITAGDKHFEYDVFTSFAVLEDGAMSSLQLLPQKRFMVPITLYLDPAQEDDIIEALGNYLPFEHRERDFTERMSSRFRF